MMAFKFVHSLSVMLMSFGSCSTVLSFALDPSFVRWVNLAQSSSKQVQKTRLGPNTWIEQLNMLYLVYCTVLYSRRCAVHQ